MATVQEVEKDQVDLVLENLLKNVDNIIQPEKADLLERLKTGTSKLYKMTHGEDTVADFFITVENKTLILECMAGKAINGVDPCKILNEWAEYYCKHEGLNKIQINTKRVGVVKKFIGLDFSISQFVIERQIQ